MLSDHKRIFVTGASGWIGSQICSYLKERDYQVIAFDISESNGPWDQIFRMDIAASPETFDYPTKVEKFGTSDTLIHCAGYAHRPSETPEEVEKFYKINAEGTQNVISWAKASGIRKFVYLSSIAFYDWTNAHELPLTEDASVAGITAYAKSKLLGEEAVRESGLDYRIVRLATVFGENDRANFSKLARAIKRRKFILPGEGDARKSVISVDAAAKYICQFALMDDPKYRLINLGFPYAPTLREICDTFSRECEFPKVKSMPANLLRAGGYFGDILQKVGISIPLTSNTLKKLTTSTWVDCTKACEMFPDLEECTFRESLNRCAEYYTNL